MELIFGTSAFIMYFIYDYNSIHMKNKFLKSFFLLGTLFLAITTIYVLVISFNNKNIAMLILMIFLSLLFLILLIYALFFAIPFNDTYIKDSEERLAYTKGIYGLCRHPGMLLFTGLYLSLWGITSNLTSGLFFILMIILDFLYIVYQDLYIFPKTFTNYNDYKSFTPFIFPKIRKEKLKNE